jgi:hypothetical protein
MHKPRIGIVDEQTLIAEAVKKLMSQRIHVPTGIDG